MCYQYTNQLQYYKPFQYYKSYDLIKNNERFKLDLAFERSLKLIYPAIFQSLKEIICGFSVTEITLYRTNTYIAIKFSLIGNQP
jgi:hypothetical protein